MNISKILMSVSNQKKSDAQKALWNDPAYREKMMTHHKAKRDKGNDDLSCEKKEEFKRNPESSKLRNSYKTHGNSDFLKGYPVFE